MDFILATNNMKKLAEMQRILSPLGINVVTAKMLGVTLEDVEEDGETFEDNAKLKARAACKEMNMLMIQDFVLIILTVRRVSFRHASQVNTEMMKKIMTFF